MKFIFFDGQKYLATIIDYSSEIKQHQMQRVVLKDIRSFIIIYFSTESRGHLRRAVTPSEQRLRPHANTLWPLQQ